MGWNSWNPFGKNVNERVIRETADFFVTSGLKDLDLIILLSMITGRDTEIQ